MSATMMSGAAWSATMGDVLIILGVFCLYVELFKATRTTVASIVDHAISLAVFVIFLVEFIIIKGAGTSTFLILGLMSLLDVVAGFTITISTARRDLLVDR
ncbi:MAG: hypothetical protein BWK79_07010 [Beggiatoa sp. IS2]|nr:MAG: hypothetical protein BWK79_07010 [Beggiatoa sp. IS2]